MIKMEDKKYTVLRESSKYFSNRYGKGHAQDPFAFDPEFSTVIINNESFLGDVQPFIDMYLTEEDDEIRAALEIRARETAARFPKQEARIIMNDYLDSFFAYLRAVYDKINGIGPEAEEEEE